MTIKEQPKPRKAFVPGMRKKYGQNALTISRFLWLFVFLWFPSRQKEKMLSFSLLAGAFLCLSIEQRFACSRFFRTDVLSSQHREEIGDRGLETRRFRYDYSFIFLLLIPFLCSRLDISSLSRLSWLYIPKHALHGCSADSPSASSLSTQKASSSPVLSSCSNS